MYNFYAQSGHEAIADPTFMKLFWDYCDEAREEYYDPDYEKRYLLGLTIISIHSNDEFIGFCVCGDNTNPDNMDDFFIGEFYIKPNYRSVEVLHWFRKKMVKSLSELGYKTWTICVPFDKVKRVRSYERLGWTVEKHDGEYYVMTMTMKGNKYG